MSEIRVNKLINEAGTGSVELTQGATLPSGKTVSGAGNLNLTGVGTFGSVSAATGSFTTGSFTGNVSVGGTLTYEDVKNIDSVGLITARSGISVTGGNTSIKGAVEAVTTGVYATGADPVSGITTGILTLDTELGTVFTHDVGSNQAVGVVSITNFPVTANSFHTVSVIFTSSGYGNTTTATGIGTNVTLTPSGVSGFSTESRVGAGDSISLTTTSGRDDIVTFGIHYNGSGTGTPGNYKSYVTKSGDFRLIRG